MQTIDEAQSSNGHERVAALQSELKTEADALKDVSAALRPVARESAYKDLEKLARVIADARDATSALPESSARGRALALLEELESDRTAKLHELRERLGPDLKKACDAAGLAMKVLSKEDPIRVRIPPFGVTIDRTKGSATLEFARESVLECAAEADAIVRAHGDATAAMGADFDAEAFFGACLNAWKAAVATGAAGDATKRVEIRTFMPFLAFQLQGDGFHKNPGPKTFEEVSRARFAYDVMRLRRARLLIHDGWRLNLGVATGTSASNKKNVIWFEDENGEGEYKLTVFFTRMDGGDDA